MKQKEEPHQAYISLGVCSVAKTAVILCTAIITAATENILAAQELPHHSGQCVCSRVKSSYPGPVDVYKETD